MYKRRARILFLASDPEDVACARQAAQTLGSGWLEPVGDAQDTPIDLVVSLDAQAACAAPARGVAHKHWPLGPMRAEDIHRHVASLVGGMRLLAAVDDSGPPPADA
ncbi:MAG: hypothetical protein M0Z44_05040 [Gammaproteobacteria bacterium]|nr:hypothetical protein [Gammaproteobacteria bacterium]